LSSVNFILKNTEKNKGTLSKHGYLRGLPRNVVRRIEAAYESGDLGYGVSIPRDTRPDGSSRRGEFPEWVYRLLEASSAVEDELEHASARNRDVVNELRRRRNNWLDIIGENEKISR
jgi:hypothetical protein